MFHIHYTLTYRDQPMLISLRADGNNLRINYAFNERNPASPDKQYTNFVNLVDELMEHETRVTPPDERNATLFTGPTTAVSQVYDDLCAKLKGLGAEAELPGIPANKSKTSTGVSSGVDALLFSTLQSFVTEHLSPDKDASADEYRTVAQGIITQHRQHGGDTTKAQGEVVRYLQRLLFTSRECNSALGSVLQDVIEVGAMNIQRATQLGG